MEVAILTPASRNNYNLGSQSHYSEISRNTLLEVRIASSTLLRLEAMKPAKKIYDSVYSQPLLNHLYSVTHQRKVCELD